MYIYIPIYFIFHVFIYIFKTDENVFLLEIDHKTFSKCYIPLSSIHSNHLKQNLKQNVTLKTTFVPNPQRKTSRISPHTNGNYDKLHKYIEMNPQITRFFV